MIYCMIPVGRLTDEMLEASTTPDLDTARVTPDGRVVLAYRGDPPASAARFVTRDRDGADEWLASRPVPETVEAHLAAVETQRRAARDALGGGR